VLYFDTSFLVPLLVPEKTSARIYQFFQQVRKDEWAVSHWTRAEFASMLAREVRMGNRDARTAARDDANFEEMIRQSFAVLLPNVDDFAVAKQFLLRFETRLRAGDALHLAIAQNHGATTIYSLDTGLIRAGRRLGLAMSSASGVAS
jgi:uncharacterized protein